LDEQPATTIRDATRCSLESLVNGNHRISIVAVDEAGNRQVPPTTESFVVRVLPVPRFVNPEPNALLNQGDLAASWTGEHNCEPDSELLYSLKVDDRDWSEFDPSTSSDVTGLEDGEHAFFLRAKDALGNMSEDGTSVRFEIDMTPPDCVAEEVPREWDKLDLEWPSLPDFKVEFRVTGTDNRTPADDLELRYRLDDKDSSDWLPITEAIVLGGLVDAMHKISFETRDQAQNIQVEPSTINFDFNTPPNTRVWLDETREPTTFRFAGKDDNSNASDLSFRWRLDEQPWSDWNVLAEVPASRVREGASHGEHTLQVQARDAAGNVDISPAELVIEVDTLPPDVPTGLIANDREDGAIVELSWAAVSEPNVRYNVYRSTNEKFDRGNAALVVPLVQRNRTSDRPTRLENTTTYYYYVTSVDRSNNESEACGPYAIEILGEIEIREKEFKAIVVRASDLIQAGQWGEVSALTSEGMSPPAGYEPYPDYWNAIAQAGVSLSEEPAQIQNLLGARKALADFLKNHPGFSETPLVQERFEEVKSKILWNRMKVYGIYGGVLVVLLVILAILYKWVQNRKITQMPMITVTEGADEITPSKEALKDPTVLRRWAEVQADSESSENWSRLAFAFHNIGEVENAIQSLYKALEIAPENTRFHFQMGHFQKEADNLRESVRHFERYLQLNPESKKSAEEVEELLEKLKEEIKKS
jgi:tetratricopeptide (TPR) repeat protein